MKQRTLYIIKIILGAYLTFIGSMLFMDVYAQKPSDMQIKILLAVVFVIIGIVYIVQSIKKMLEKSQKAKAERISKQQEEEMERRYRELHSSDKFRTAPMKVVRPVRLEPTEEELEDFEEERIIVNNYEEDVIKEKKERMSEIFEKTEKKRVPEEAVDKKDTIQPSINIVEMNRSQRDEEVTVTEDLPINIEISEKDNDEEK